MKFRLIVTPPAQDDIYHILAYTLETWGEKQIKSYNAILDRALLRITENPHLHPKRDDVTNSYRSYITGQYVIFYRIEEKTVYVIRILHQRMNVGQHLGEGE